MTASANVLVVYHHLPHYRHGVFQHLQRQAELSYEFAADVVSRDGSIPTIPPECFGAFHRLRNRWFGQVLWQAGLLRLLWRKRYAAVVFLGDVAHSTTWVGALLCRLLGCRVLFWTIGWHRPERGVRRLVRMLFYNLAHGLLLYGETGRNLGAQLGYPPAKMTVIGNSHASYVSTAPDATPIDIPTLVGLLPPPGREVLTAVIRLNPEKRLDLLIRAGAELRSRGREPVVVLVGAGPEFESLRALAAELDVELVLTGPVYSEAHLRHVYERTTVTVVPACAGLTSIQSLIHGRPVITCGDEFNQMPESACVVPGRTGDFYADGSIESLATTIDSWLDRVKSDPEGVAAACQAEVDARWSPEMHASAVTDAVRRQLAMVGEASCR